MPEAFQTGETQMPAAFQTGRIKHRSLISNDAVSADALCSTRISSVAIHFAKRDFEVLLIDFLFNIPALYHKWGLLDRGIVHILLSD